VIGVVVGCKADLSEDRQVSKLEGQELAIRYNARYVEVSAKTDFGIAEMFEALGKSMLSRHLGWNPDPRLHANESTKSVILSLPSRPTSMLASMARSKSLGKSFRLKRRRNTSKSSAGVQCWSADLDTIIDVKEPKKESKIKSCCTIL
jgi:hypothetical protein